MFVVTQICVDDENNLTITGSTLNEIPLMDDCTEFEPGLALPAGEVVTATDSSGGSHPVILTGVWMKK